VDRGHAREEAGREFEAPQGLGVCVVRDWIQADLINLELHAAGRQSMVAWTGPLLSEAWQHGYLQVFAWGIQGTKSLRIESDVLAGDKVASSFPS
jgi:hypothetical protein